MQPLITCVFSFQNVPYSQIPNRDSLVLGQSCFVEFWKKCQRVCKFLGMKMLSSRIPVLSFSVAAFIPFKLNHIDLCFHPTWNPTCSCELNKQGNVELVKQNHFILYQDLQCSSVNTYIIYYWQPEIHLLIKNPVL